MLEGCSPASPPSVRAHVGLGPVSRTPVRAELTCTRYSAEYRASMSARVKNSGAPCGPSVTAIVHSDARCGRRSAGVGAGAATAADPGRSTSPVTSARPPCPPKPPSVKVDALPRYDGTSMPPRTARKTRMPGPSAVPMRSTPPAGTSIGSHCAAATPSTSTVTGAPVTATTDATLKRRVGPVSVISSPAPPRGCRRRGWPRGRTRHPSGRTAGRRFASTRRVRGGPARS